jgi:hypothetical protein
LGHEDEAKGSPTKPQREPPTVPGARKKQFNSLETPDEETEKADFSVLAKGGDYWGSQTVEPVNTNKLQFSNNSIIRNNLDVQHNKIKILIKKSNTPVYDPKPRPIIPYDWNCRAIQCGAGELDWCFYT